MHCRGGIEIVLHDPFNFIAAAQADNGSEDRGRVAVCAHGLSCEESVMAGHGFKIDDLPRCRRIDQSRDR